MAGFSSLSLLSPQRGSAVADLLRLLAVYLAAVLALQGLAAAFALGSGPLHRHRGTPLSVASLAFSHHEQQHRSGERHHHAADDHSVLPVADAPEESLDAAAFALTAALSLLAIVGITLTGRDGRRHVWRAALPWAWRAGLPGFLFKPPRAS